MKLIANARPASASLGQNSKSNYDDGTSRKIAELYLACLVAHFGTNVKLDDPKASSNGRNPDVLFDFSGFAPIAHPAQQWALAVKTISSQQGQTVFDQIKGGAKQIDDSRCSASRGIVVINTKDALDHGALWQGTYRDAEHALSVLRAQLEGLTQKAMLNRDQSEWDSLFVGKVARPVLFLGQSLVRLRTSKSQLTPTPLRMLCCFEPVGNNGINDPIGLDIAERMNHLMQTIGWFPT